MPNAGEVGRQSSGFLREKALRSEEKDSGMKYLIMEDFAGQPVSFVFPRRVDHGDMREQLPYGQVLSCGVLELGPDGFICSGGNNELGVKARPEEDAAIIAEALRRRRK